MASLRADVDAILDAWVHEAEAPTTEPTEDMVPAVVFHKTSTQPPIPCEHAKSHRTREGYEGRAMKKECTELEDVR